MATESASPVVLVSVLHEFEAVTIVHSLEEHGIRARSIGGYTSGFQVEIAGDVKVVVSQSDVDRATEILEEIREGDPLGSESRIGIEDSRLIPEREKLFIPENAGKGGSERHAASGKKRARFQFSLLQLLAVQTVLCVVFASFSVTGPLVCALALVTATIMLIIRGTVAIASDLSRTRQVWSYVGGAMICVSGVFVLFELALQFLG